jgi:hypothetical protein
MQDVRGTLIQDVVTGALTRILLKIRRAASNTDLDQYLLLRSRRYNVVPTSAGAIQALLCSTRRSGDTTFGPAG